MLLLPYRPMHVRMKPRLFSNSPAARFLSSTTLWLVAVLAIGSSTLLNAQTQAAGSSTVQASPDYLIGPSDTLTISVWKDTELSRTLPVRPDGRISLPLIGELLVSGLTTKAVQDAIVKKLKDYISDPQVTVIVQEVKSRTYIILGKILKPGSYPLGKPTTVLEAIAIAGGFQDFAKQTKIYIMRPASGGGTQTIHFNYKNAIKQHNPAADPYLQNGDTLIVP